MIVYQSLSEEDSLNHIPVKGIAHPKIKIVNIYSFQNGMQLFYSAGHKKLLRIILKKISKWLHSIQQLIVGYKDQ